ERARSHPRQHIGRGRHPHHQRPRLLHPRHRLIVGPRDRLRPRRQPRRQRARLGHPEAQPLHRLAPRKHKRPHIHHPPRSTTLGQPPLDHRQRLIGRRLIHGPQRDHHVIAPQPVGLHLIPMPQPQDPQVQRLRHPHRHLSHPRHRTGRLRRLHQRHRIVILRPTHLHPHHRPHRRRPTHRRHRSRHDRAPLLTGGCTHRLPPSENLPRYVIPNAL